MKLCENCGKEHTGEYASGRFCTRKCARGFSSKNNREEISKKVSDTLKRIFANKIINGLTKQQRIEKDLAEKHASYIRETEITSLFDLSNRTTVKILKRLKLPCSNCNWYVENVVGDIHHIIQKKYGGSNNHDNLCYLCPNCHRLVHSNKIDSKNLINLTDYIGDRWKDFYYVKNKKIIPK